MCVYEELWDSGFVSVWLHKYGVDAFVNALSRLCVLLFCVLLWDCVCVSVCVFVWCVVLGWSLCVCVCVCVQQVVIQVRGTERTSKSSHRDLNKNVKFVCSSTSPRDEHKN